MYTFQQSTGVFFSPDSPLAVRGWAGQGPGKNNPGMQDVHNIGPLPRGFYTIGQAYEHPHLGPCVMNLTPAPSNEMFGRSSFRIHGASKSDPEHSSEGCIILPPGPRHAVADSLDRRLEVVE